MMMRMEDSRPPPRPRKQRKRPPRTKRGGPQAQQMKVMFRQIQDMDRYGTVKSILDMMRSIVEKTNEENKNKAVYLPMRLDEDSMQRLVETEELVAAAKEAAAAEAKEEKEEAEKEEEKDTDEPMEENKEEPMETDAAPKQEDEKPNDATKQQEAAPKFSTVVKGVDPLTGPVLNARALYVVPPKKSRRRGIKSGCAYLVLTTPTVADEEGANMTQMERSRTVAKARLQLATAVEALSKHAAAQDEQQYGGCVVQTAMCGKAWKPSYRDQREGMVETTADYRKFMARMEKEKEERLARPRPTPGGLLDDGKSDNGEQVAAIVVHLRAKRVQELRRKKAAKRKNAAAKDKGGKPGKNPPGSRRGGGGGGAKPRRGRGASMKSAPSSMMRSTG